MKLYLGLGLVTDWEVRETNYPGYARVPLSPHASSWAFRGKFITNALRIDFPECIADPPYPGIHTVNAWLLCDQDMAVLMHGSLTHDGRGMAMQIARGITPTFTRGALELPAERLGWTNEDRILFRSTA